MAALLSVADALARVLDGVKPLPREDAALTDADGRVLAADVAARRTQPPADLSAMDGYAVRAADVASVPVTLKVAGEVAAGHPFEGEVHSGEAARIFTGGVIPPGADTIVIQENTTRDGERVIVNAPSPAGRHIRRAGLDFKEGQVLLPRGKRLTDRDVMLAAAMSHPAVPVHRRPKVAVLGTGDELKAPGATLGPGEIVYSNGFALMALARAEGAEVDRPRHRAGPGRGDERCDPARARCRRRRPVDHRRRVGRRLRPGAARLEGRRAGAVVLAGGAAARPADDERPARRDARPRPARQSGVGLCLRVPVPGAAASHALPDGATSSRRANRRCSAPTCPENDERADYLRATLAPGPTELGSPRRSGSRTPR